MSYRLSGRDQPDSDELPTPSTYPNLRFPTTQLSSLQAKVTMGPDGRVTIPADMRQAMDWREGDAVLAVLDHDGELRFVTLAETFERLPGINQKYRPRTKESDRDI